ncbi:MAG: bacterial transcriptional activator domain-containing protein [Chloroflexota bacterium]|nr:bacterial transcriptional activator domain-containing protein [Chloroflexota bacterium]
MSGSARLRAGSVLCLPPAAGRPNDWLRFWRLPAEEVRFSGDGRVELPLVGYVRLKLHPVWAPSPEHMAGLFGLEAQAVVDCGDGWVLVPVPNGAMAVREGRVLLWCVSLAPDVVDLEEMVLGTRHRQWHLFYQETQRYRRRLGYSPAEEGEVLYGGAVGGKVPYGCRVVLPARLLRPEEAMGAPAGGWAPAAEMAFPEREQEEARWAPAPEGALPEAPSAPAAPPPAPDAVPQEAPVPSLPWAGEGEEEVTPAEGRPGRGGRRRPLPLREAALAIARAASSLVMRPEEPEPEEGGDGATDYLEVMGGVRTLLWALSEKGLPVRGVPAVWARGRAAGLVVELSREVDEQAVGAAVEKAAKELRAPVQRLRRVAGRMWELSCGELPPARPEGATVAVAAVPVGRREEQGAAPWVVLMDLGSPGGLLLDASPQDEARFLSWWVAAASLALPGLQVWAQEGTAAERQAVRRLASPGEAVDALYDEVVGRFEAEGRQAAPLLVVMRLPEEREREMAVTLAARGPEVGCYLVALGPAEAGRFPAWVKVREGLVEAEIAGGRARLSLPQVEGPVEGMAPVGETAAAGPSMTGREGLAEAAGMSLPARDEGLHLDEEGVAEAAPVDERAAAATPDAAAAEEAPPPPDEGGPQEGQPGSEGPAEERAEEGPAWAEAPALEGGASVLTDELSAPVASPEDREGLEPAAEGPLPTAEGPAGEGVAAGPVGRPLEVAVLGPLRTSLALDRQAARELLALLVLREGEIGRDEAAALLEEGRLGSGVGVAYALNKLRLAVKALRRACEEAGLPRGIFGVQRSGQVVVVRQWVHCDLWEALELATAVAGGMGGEAEVRRLADLVRGPILEGDAYSWAEQEAARVERRLKGLLLRAARRLAGEGRHELAVELAEAVRRLDPLDEAALRQELESLLAQGQAARARGIYRSFLRDLRRLLDDEEATPEDETVELARRLEEAG